MIAVGVCLAATVGAIGSHAPLNTVGQIATALTPFLGSIGGKILFGLGMFGAAIVAAIVASLAGAWGVAEVFGWKHSLNERPNRANAKFYVTYALAHILGAIFVLGGSANLVGLSVDVEVMNALLLPIVLGFLLVLEAKALPAEWRMGGRHKYMAWSLCLVVMAFGLYMIPSVLGISL